MRLRLATGLLAILSLGVSVLPFPPLGEDEWQRLREGEIVVQSARDDADGAYLVTISGLYQETPDVVWDVIGDCARFHEFMPRMSESEVALAQDGSSICRTVSDMPMPLADLESAVRTWTETRSDGSLQRHFEQVPGDWSYERNEGVWSVSPHPGPGGNTLLRYRLAVVPRMAVPGFIVRAAQERTAPESFEAIRAEARRRRPTAISAGPPRD